MKHGANHRPSKQRLILVAAAVLAGACHGGAGAKASSPPAAPDRVANLHAFARLYGVVRWFHPSDAAAVIDWDQFAVDGARRVIDAPDRAALRTRLAGLFAPMAPTVHLATVSESFPADPALQPPTGANSEVVAWEHIGYGDSTFTSVYASKRRHRPRSVPLAGAAFASLWQAVDATSYRGTRVRLRGQLRTAKQGLGRLWMRVDRGDQRGFFDNMSDRPVASATWRPAEVVGTVDPDATRIVFGVLMIGGGTVWYDDLELAAEAPDHTWRTIGIEDPGFESTDPTARWHPGTGRASNTTIEGWNATPDPLYPAAGNTALRIEPATRVITDELFAEAPAPGETADIDLGSGLRARVPLSLYSLHGHTAGDDPARARQSQMTPPRAPSVGFDTVAGIADVIVVWSALEHFWPYWSDVAVDWNAELDRALADALDDHSVSDHLATLGRLSAAAPDGHAQTTCPGQTPSVKPPFVTDMVEGQIVVTATAAPGLAPGDVIVSVDGRSAREQLAADAALASGSPQWRLVRACQQLGAGPPGIALALRVRRGDREFEVTIERGNNSLGEFSHPQIERLDGGVYYVDLGRATMTEINAAMEQLATAPGIVFDLRGYPNNNHDVLSHLLDHPVNLVEGMSLPHVIRPDHGPAAMPTWEPANEVFPALPPRITGRVAFLTGPGAISYAETVMALVEYHHLGAIVGAPTAGTNGNIGEISEPTGCRTKFTAMRVNKPDGRRHYMVGIQPTIPASRTIAGVAAGRDEVLERALVYVRAGT
jgi:C-terminal processing protease CtpA/Prc